MSDITSVTTSVDISPSNFKPDTRISVRIRCQPERLLTEQDRVIAYNIASPDFDPKHAGGNLELGGDLEAKTCDVQLRMTGDKAATIIYVLLSCSGEFLSHRCFNIVRQPDNSYRVW